MSYYYTWDNILPDTTDPALLTLSPPGTFILRISTTAQSFDGGTNYQCFLTHTDSPGRDFSLWAADNNLATLDTNGGRSVQGFALSNQTSIQFDAIANGLIYVKDEDGYFLLEYTDPAHPADSTANFANTLKLYVEFNSIYSSAGLRFNNTNLPDPVIEQADGGTQTILNRVAFSSPILQQVGGGSSGQTPGRPDENLLYPRGFQTQGSYTPTPPGTDDPLGDDELPAGALFTLITSTQSANLTEGDAQTFVVSDRRYLNYDMRAVPGGDSPIEPPGATPTDYYIYYLDNASQRQEIILPQATGNAGSSNTWRQMGWDLTSPDTTDLISILGYDTEFVITDTRVT